MTNPFKTREIDVKKQNSNRGLTYGVTRQGNEGRT